jgi:hypothetical protein
MAAREIGQLSVIDALAPWRAALGQGTRSSIMLRSVGSNDSRLNVMHRFGTFDVPQVSAPDLIERALLRQTAATPRPDDRAGVRTISPIEPAQLAVVSTGADSGFHWNDAGIGAGTALILALAAGLVLVQFRRHRPVLH